MILALAILSTTVFLVLTNGRYKVVQREEGILSTLNFRMLTAVRRVTRLNLHPPMTYDWRDGTVGSGEIHHHVTFCAIDIS